MKEKDGKNLDFIARIAPRYFEFGVVLLQDYSGAEMEAIRIDNQSGGPQAITQAILRRWLRDGGNTCTYSHLISCMWDVGMGTLAEERERFYKK